MQISTLLLAGARASGDPLCELHDVTSKALIPLLDVRMIDHVLRALRDNVQASGPVWISGLDINTIARDAPDDLRDFISGLRQAPAAGGPASSVCAAAESNTQTPFLITTCDHPLLTAEMIDSFLAGATKSGADTVAALARREVIEQAYPDVQRTYIKLSQGHYSGCNLFYISSNKGLEAVRFWREAEKDRKRPLKIARRFGLVALVKMRAGLMTLDSVFEYGSKVIGARIKPVLLPFPDAAIDVDKTSDLELVRSIMEARN